MPLKAVEKPAAVLPKARKASTQARAIPYLHGIKATDVMVLAASEDRWEVKMRGAAWPFQSFHLEEGALDSGRDLAKLWRCSVVVIDRAGRVRIRESYSGA
jgi:hypothetical protein